MSFDSPLFLFFLPLTLSFYYLLPSLIARRALFVLSGLFFLAALNLTSVLVASAFICIVFIGACLIDRSPPSRSLWLRLTLFAVALILVGLKLNQRYFHTVFYPLGFSFYTFASVTFLVDVYNRKVTPLFWRYSSAILFFPLLISGPIFRTADLIGQQDSPLPLDWPLARESAVKIAVGFFKKGISVLISIVFMSRLATEQRHSGAFAWLYVLMFMAKYYADFSGYSDIAIGTAGLFGIRVPINFNLPFFSRSIPDFWRRWHITLGWWTNHYIFRPLIYSEALGWLRRIPSCGERIFQERFYFATICAMIILGVWHGLTLNFLLWGIYMGVLICVDTAWLSPKLRYQPAGLQIALTFFLVLNGFVIFIAATPAEAFSVWSRMYGGGTFTLSHLWLISASYCCLALILPHAVDAILIRFNYLRDRPMPALVACAFLLAVYFLLDGFSGATFEYGKF